MYEVKIVYQVFIKFLLGLGIECSIKMSEVKIVKIYSTFVKLLVAIECSIMYNRVAKVVTIHNDLLTQHYRDLTTQPNEPEKLLIFH